MILNDPWAIDLNHHGESRFDARCRSLVTAGISQGYRSGWTRMALDRGRRVGVTDAPIMASAWADDHQDGEPRSQVSGWPRSSVRCLDPTYSVIYRPRYSQRRQTRAWRRRARRRA